MGGSGSTASADVRQKLLNILALESLGEQLGPDRLNVNVGGLDQGLQLVGL